MKRRLWGAVAAVVLLSGVPFALFGWSRRSLPLLSGSLHVAGLGAPIEIVRDREAIPHIFATSDADAQFGLGFVHGQDRLWQLELLRRVGAGRLAEIFGAEALSEDRLLRTVGLRRAAARSWPELDEQTHAVLESYAAGVNAAIAETKVLPPEFAALGVSPEPWTALDALVTLRVLAWQLAVQWTRELLRAELASELPPSELSALLGGDAAWLASGRAVLGVLSSAREAFGALAAIDSSYAFTSRGSNSWVLSGARTESGAPLLANDPHLELNAPAVWYLAHLHAPDLDVIGATVPGLPGVILGQNARVAWGFTNNRADAQDLYLERLDAGDPTRYIAPDGARSFEVVEEGIMVKDGKRELLKVRSTRHGPVISDVNDQARRLMPPGYVLALRYAALEPGDRSVRFPLRASHAKSVEELLAAASELASPPQNVTVADAAGRIAFVAAGRVPVRSAERGRGLLPLPGWLAVYDWLGFVPFAELPQASAPASGALVSANQDLAGPGYAHFLGADFAAPWRAQRIERLLDERLRHSAQSLRAMQLDERSEPAAQLVSRWLPPPPRDRFGPLAAAIDRLRRWDFVMRRGAPEPLIYAAWLRELLVSAYQDDLGERWADVVTDAAERLTDRLNDPACAFCDDRRTPDHETCAALSAGALERAIGSLTEEYGRDVARWSWGTAHRAHFRHVPFSQLPVLGRWLDVELPSGGGNDTVNLSESLLADPERPFEARYGPNYRAVYDLGDRRASRFIAAPGQSGNPWSPYYRHWAERWLRGDAVPMLTARSDIDAQSIGTLRLSPTVVAPRVR